MPVEIRELVIKATVQDHSNTGETTNPVQMAGPDGQLLAEPSAEWIKKVVEICMLEMKTWMAENSIR